MPKMYRHRMTGILGTLEISPSGDKVVRANEGWTSPLRDWVRELAWRPVQRSQLAIAAYAADAAISALYTHRKPQAWMDLSEDERAGFISTGPLAIKKNRDNLDMRKSVYDFIMSKLDAANVTVEED